MSVLPVFIDSRPGYLGSRPDGPTLLTTPLGKGTFLGSLGELAGQVTDEPLTILTTFQPGARYVSALEERHPRVRAVVVANRLRELFAPLEPSDEVLLIDPRRFPINGYPLAKLMGQGEAGRITRHVLLVESRSEGVQELVIWDDENHISRIDRYYPGITWHQTSDVACCVVPATAGLSAAFRGFESLSELRQDLIAQGHPARDVLLDGETFDLTRQEGLLGLMERGLLSEGFAPSPRTDAETADRVESGSGCRVDSTARLLGPVVLQDDVSIGPDVLIVGPALVGSGARIERNSILAQCLVLQGAAVPRETTVAHQVLRGPEEGESIGSTEDYRSHLSCPPGRFHPPSAMLAPFPETASRSRRRYLEARRVVEIVVASIGLIVLSPILLLIAVLIKLGSRGPVLFGHEREGRNGRAFRCLKFRTMVEGAHSLQRELYRENCADGPQFMLRTDPRVTRMGRFLRLINLDELPQLINVILGDMSLVGPRPSPFRENQICVPWRRARLSVPPGITGLWQVCRQDRLSGDFHQWIHYDMLYVRHMSPWLDVKILVATALSLGGRRSVPLRWMIPPRKLAVEREVAALARQADHREISTLMEGYSFSVRSEEDLPVTDVASSIQDPG
ncbi:MAG: sugar transferase [Phycisphaerae bacterium]|nr:sugar transferase [Phycisphaerae bacterium]